MSRSRRHGFFEDGRLVAVGIVVLVLWGVATFGAVHDWSRNTIVAATTAVAAMMTPRLRRRDVSALFLVALLTGVIALQLLPLPPRVTALLGNRVLVDNELILGRASGPQTISVVPSATVFAVPIVAAFGFFVISFAAQLRERHETLWLLPPAMCAMGTLVALEGLAQKALFNGKIYWYWQSVQKADYNYFGPFVNRNHFAGWMILCASLCAGWMIGQVALARRSTKSNWREWMLWWSSNEAARIQLCVAALFVMIVAVVFTMSRSGIFGLTVAITIVAVTALASAGSSRSGLSAFATVILLVGAAFALKGVGRLSSWYATTNTLEWRIALWRDAMRPLRDFALFGSGINTFGPLMLAYPTVDTTVYAHEAHNDYLQLAVEGGLLVGIPAVITAIAIVRTIWRRLKTPQSEMRWWIRLGAAAGLCGIAIQEITEFSLQIPGVAFLFCVVLAIAIHQPPAQSDRRVTLSRVVARNRMAEGGSA
jgi:O-antigen ligase